MHICPEEIAAVAAALPFVGFICMKCRQICVKCVSLLRRLTGRDCVHHDHQEK